ncbi:flagellar basal body-associated FliL family protein [Halocella sp. SP3-1]|uniref:flagellar basal body-associated FliL family protein n=1 Tax=Halocella sp. SP3-1 TaxID=2382161 RepID=UPI000F76508A|nr:flagellar basal body-associated FliL family protein [Halocella sp. SP3-1]AZO94049.1 flagellar basal body-associated protein FliL [Halocella sp. SP3-1]
MANEGLSFKSILGIALLMVVIAIGTSYGFMKFITTNDNSPVLNENAIGPTYSLGDFVVNLSGTRGYQYIRASIVVEVSTDNVITELEKRSPQVRDSIIGILRDQQVADIEEPGARVIKNRLITKLNDILRTGDITQVWFTQLVVQ